MSASKRRGTAFERATADWLAANGHPAADRSPLRGKLDRGDLVGIGDWVLELKATRSIDLAGAVDEAAREAKNAGKDRYAAVIKRRGKGPQGAYVVMPLALFAKVIA